MRRWVWNDKVRSGRRNKLAAEDLQKLGYTNIREFGGIIDWPYGGGMKW